MTSSNVSALLALCGGNPPVTGGCPSKRPVTHCFDVFFDVRQNNQLNKQFMHRWFETPWCPCDVTVIERSFSWHIFATLYYCRCSRINGMVLHVTLWWSIFRLNVPEDTQIVSISRRWHVDNRMLTIWPHSQRFHSLTCRNTFAVGIGSDTNFHLDCLW